MKFGTLVGVPCSWELNPKNRVQLFYFILFHFLLDKDNVGNLSKEDPFYSTKASKI